MELVDTLCTVFGVLFLVGSALLSLVILAGIWWRQQSGEGLVRVIVLGDAGRSPRMQYHCLSLVKLDYKVDLVGYGGSPLIKELRESQRLTHHKLYEPPAFFNSMPGVLRYAAKVLFQLFNLSMVIFLTKKPSHILIQTPPAIPTLFVSIVMSLLQGSKLIVDYHNYGHTILALSLGNQHMLVKLAKLYEKLFAGYAHANLCVSEAMKKDLTRRLGVDAIILYDRPAGMFHPTTVEERHKLFQKLADSEQEFKPPPLDLEGSDLESVTLFTEESKSGKVSMREERPFLVISSTSWTKDEDFGILLQALEIYEEKVTLDEDLPKILCVITGKGPQKDYYMGIIAKKNFSHVTICTLWLEIEDYPVLLGSADLGVCLHKSSSGLDLPMKVVDMFGSGIPVCAVNFNCLHELLRHKHNGLIFNDYKELAEQLQVLSRGFPANNVLLSRLKDNLSSFQSLRWDHYWKLHVLPLIASLDRGQ